MSWLVHHTRSEGYASQAEELCRRHEGDRVAALYRLAAEAEANALDNLDPSKTRTIGITAVSAVSLYFKAQEFWQARKLAHKWLATDLLPPFAVEELEDLLQAIRFEESRFRSDIRFTEGDILITLSGGDVAHGEAPLELFLRKLEQISNILYRTTELMLGLPIRSHGAPSQTVKSFCDPWLLPHSSKEHQFSFALIIHKPQAQLAITGLEDDRITVEEIGERFFEIIRATVHNPEGEELKSLIPDIKYREIFMKLIRYVAPPSTGKPFSRMELTLNYGVKNISVALSSSTRQVIDAAIKTLQMSFSEYSLEEEASLQIRGILRGFQPEKNWIDVRVNGEVKRIYDAETEIDDVVIPMVNRRVVAEVVERSDRSVEKRYSLRDLQLEEDLL